MDNNPTSHTLHKLLTDNEPIDRAHMELWAKLYPYFSIPLMIYTRNNHANDNEALKLSTIYASDIELWASQLGLRTDFTTFAVPADTATQSTVEAIDLFLNTYSKEDDYAVELPIAEEKDSNMTSSTTIDNHKRVGEPETPLITIPAYDYMSQLETMPDASDAHPMQGNDLLEKFLEADAAGEQLFSKPQYNPQVEATTTQQPANEENESFFSESLAKIYIQQRRYAKALEIIRKLNLNNPEKNIYFADQIRFLEKLIINVKN